MIRSALQRARRMPNQRQQVVRRRVVPALSAKRVGSARNANQLAQLSVKVAVIRRLAHVRSDANQVTRVTGAMFHAEKDAWELVTAKKVHAQPAKLGSGVSPVN